MTEAAQTSAPEKDAAARTASRRRRSVALALTLVGFVVLVFVLTLVRLKDQVFDKV